MKKQLIITVLSTFVILLIAIAITMSYFNQRHVSWDLTSTRDIREFGWPRDNRSTWDISGARKFEIRADSIVITGISSLISAKHSLETIDRVHIVTLDMDSSRAHAYAEKIIALNNLERYGSTETAILDLDEWLTNQPDPLYQSYSAAREIEGLHVFLEIVDSFDTNRPWHVRVTLSYRALVPAQRPVTEKEDDL